MRRPGGLSRRLSRLAGPSGSSEEHAVTSSSPEEQPRADTGRESEGVAEHEPREPSVRRSRRVGARDTDEGDIDDSFVAAIDPLDAGPEDPPALAGRSRSFGDRESDDEGHVFLDLDDLPDPEPRRFEAGIEPWPEVGAGAMRERPIVLDELRARISRVLERSPVDRAKPPPDVDFPELPFVAEDGALGVLHVRSRKLSAAHRVGTVHVGPAAEAKAEVLALLALDPSLAGCDPKRALYLDTETTGLSGGTGTVAFLLGLAYWDGGWITEQILVRQLGEEAPMLARVAERIASSEMLVTFNGKSFDMPLLRTRFVLAGLPLPVEPPHLDLVHVARRLHKARGVACKLTKLEEEVLGFVRHDDVPSGEVAGHYLHFLRTGDTRGLVGVVEHNAWDVEAMVAFVALYGEPLDETRLGAKDLVGIAETLRRSQRLDDALTFADRAVREGAGPDGLRARAMLKKARGEREAALVDFEELAAQVDCPKARLELAKLYEHVRKAPALALAVASRGTAERPDLADKRRARLEKKVVKGALPPKDDGPLFRSK